MCVSVSVSGFEHPPANEGILFIHAADNIDLMKDLSGVLLH